MSYFGRNIKKIRNVKKISQSAFAEIFGLTRASVGAYEEGRAEAKIDTIIEIANHFSISVDDLLSKELSIKELAHIQSYEKQGKPSAKFQIPVVNSVDIPLVNQEVLPEYMKNPRNKDFIDSLPLIRLPYSLQLVMRAFEYQGTGLQCPDNAISPGDILICSLTKKENIHPRRYYVAIFDDQAFFGKLEKKNDTLVIILCSENETATTVNAKKLIEIWEIAGFFSTRVIRNEPKGNLDQRLHQLEKKYEEIIKKLD